LERTQPAIRVQPGAKARSGCIADAQGVEVLKIRLRALAVEGNANTVLIEFLAARLVLRPRQITLEPEAVINFALNW